MLNIIDGAAARPLPSKRRKSRIAINLPMPTLAVLSEDDARTPGRSMEPA